MSISILVVDDVRPIAEGFAGKFRRVAEAVFNISANVEALFSLDDAVSRIIDRSRPPFDLVFTDIDLHGGSNPDKAGVAFARFVKDSLPGVPLVGCSGRFEQDDLAEEDRVVFEKWWPKGGLSNNLDAIAEDTVRRAIAYHNAKPQGLSEVEGSNESSPMSKDAGLRVLTTTDEFLLDGYIQRIVEPTPENGLAAPFAGWVRNSPEGVELQVVGCGSLFTWGDTYAEAEAALLDVISDLKPTLNDPDATFSSSLLLAKRFVENVTGCRSVSASGV